MSACHFRRNLILNARGEKLCSIAVEQMRSLHCRILLVVACGFIKRYNGTVT